MNIKEIKEHYKAGEWTRQNDRFHYDPQEEKIGYLLSIIEQAEKALELFEQLYDPNINKASSEVIETVKTMASKALQVIRGSE